MSDNDGGQAFPNEGFNGWGEPETGMTLRDYYKGQALANPGLCTGIAEQWEIQAWFGKNAGGISRYQVAAKQAEFYADAMLKARA